RFVHVRGLRPPGARGPRAHVARGAGARVGPLRARVLRADVALHTDVPVRVSAPRDTGSLAGRRLRHARVRHAPRTVGRRRTVCHALRPGRTEGTRLPFPVLVRADGTRACLVRREERQARDRAARARAPRVPQPARAGTAATPAPRSHPRDDTPGAPPGGTPRPGAPPAHPLKPPAPRREGAGIAGYTDRAFVADGH